jgi:suppressor of G2 allele of SKP1
VLKKAAPQKWSTLESKSLPPASTNAVPANPTDEAVKRALLTEDRPPAYPTSSRKGPQNWDSVATNLTRKMNEDDGIKPTPGMDDDDAEGDEVGSFFKKLYKGADPETQRAMMKSYQESNGTVLSTNWSEVGKKKVETSPPDGMVAKKWGEE